MFPVLFSIAWLHVSSFWVFAVLAFFVGAFLIWRMGRDGHLPEDKVLDCIFITTGGLLFGARMAYFLLNLSQFHYNILRFPLIWKYPGLTLMGGVLGALVGLLFVSRRTKLPFWQLFDMAALGMLPVSAIVGLGGLLGVSEVGRLTNTFGVVFVGFEGLRHPIGFYEFIFGMVGYEAFRRIHKHYEVQKRSFGITGLMISIVASIFFFTLAFTKEESVYLGRLSFNQVVSAVSLLVTTILLYHKVNDGDIHGIVRRAYQAIRRIGNYAYQ